jgi:hypothetical protein
MKRPSSTAAAIDCRYSRQGVVLVTLVVLMAIALTLFGIWAQSAVHEHRRQASRLWRVQAARLAEAGLARAVARRAADPQYAGEVWSVPAESLGGIYPAKVQIRVGPTPIAEAVRYEAQAEFPSGAIRHAQITKRIEAPHTISRDEP